MIATLATSQNHYEKRWQKETFSKVFFNGGNFRASAWNCFVLL
jgi:hypothetical protein